LRKIKNIILDLSSIKRYLKDQINFYVEKLNLSFDIIDEKFLKVFEDLAFKTKVEILNGKNKDRNDYYSGRDESIILIGGVLISRGFTFENLLTEIMLNSPEIEASADTLLQRAR
jgi:hypothetical protein